MCERVEQTVTSVRKAAWRKMRNLLHALGMSYEEGGTPSPVKKKAWRDVYDVVVEEDGSEIEVMHTMHGYATTIEGIPVIASQCDALIVEGSTLSANLSTNGNNDGVTIAVGSVMRKVCDTFFFSLSIYLYLSLLMHIFIHFLSSYLQGTHKSFVVFYYSKHLDLVFPSEHSKLSVWLPNSMCSYKSIINSLLFSLLYIRKFVHSISTLFLILSSGLDCYTSFGQPYTLRHKCTLRHHEFTLRHRRYTLRHP